MSLLELARQLSISWPRLTTDLDFILVPYGGGGLCRHSHRHPCELPGCQIIGVEPGQHRMWARSLQARERLAFPVPDTLADGQQLYYSRRNTVPIIQRHGVQTVSPNNENDIRSAMAWLF